jgi:hypothetical protein
METSSQLSPPSSSAVPVTEIVIHHHLIPPPLEQPQQQQQQQQQQQHPIDDVPVDLKHPESFHHHNNKNNNNMKHISTSHSNNNNKSSSTVANTVVSIPSIASSSTKSRKSTTSHNNTTTPLLTTPTLFQNESNGGSAVVVATTTTTTTSMQQQQQQQPPMVDIPLQDLFLDRPTAAATSSSTTGSSTGTSNHPPNRNVDPNPTAPKSSGGTTGSNNNNNNNSNEKNNHNNQADSMKPPLTVIVPHHMTSNTGIMSSSSATKGGPIMENDGKGIIHHSRASVLTEPSPQTESQSQSLDTEDTILIQTFMECFGVIPAASTASSSAPPISSSNSCTTSGASSGGGSRKNLIGTYVCVRHVNYPIIFGLYSSAVSSSSSNNNNQQDEAFRIYSCRYCYMDETRCGIIARNNISPEQSPTPKSMYQILQLVQAYAMNQKMNAHQLHPGSTKTIHTNSNDSCSIHNNHNNHNNDLMGKDSERSTATDSIGDYTVSALFLQGNNHSVDNGKTSTTTNSTTGPHTIPEEITTTTTIPTSTNKNNNNNNNTHSKTARPPRSLASRILSSYRHNYNNIMELSLKRIHQVQNFTIHIYKQQILDYQEMIIKLQYDLIQKDQEYQATIKQLRRTIQQDCKVIKTMATQQQDVEYALGLSSQHQPINHISTTNTIDHDPLLASMLGIGDSSMHSVSTAATSSPNKPVVVTNTRTIPQVPPIINSKKVPFRTRSSMSQSLHQQQQPTEATIHESGQEDETETSVTTTDIVFEVPVPPALSASGTTTATTATEVATESVPPPASRGAILKLQQNWNRPKLRSRNNSNVNNDELGMKSSHEIFQSFRGGLLDIPRSPPALIRHDNVSIESQDDNDGMYPDVNDPTRPQPRLGGMKNNNKKLMMNSDMLSALQMPTRGLLSRSDSMVIPTNPNANNSSDGMTPKNNANSNYNHTLASLLVAKLQQEELDFRTNHGSEYNPIRPINSPPPITMTAKPTANPNHPHQQLPSIPIQSPDAKSPLPPNSHQLPMINIAIPTISNTDPTNERGDGSHQDDTDYENDTAIGSDADTGTEDIDHGSNTSPDKGGSSRSSNKFLFSVTGATCHDKFGDDGTYTGTILVTEGLPHGKGKMNYDSGRIYDGEWICGQWHGRGKLLNPNGDSYDGEFFFDARHGHGIYQWDNGDIYVGNFTSDKRHGRGKFSFHNGNVYEGEFCDGLFDGYGKYNFAGGSYEGNWKDGRYNGAGVLIYGSTGGKYEGEFRNSVAHGFGTEIMPDGKQRRGVWIDGKPTECLE